MSDLETELALQTIAAARRENPDVSRSEAETRASRLLVSQGFGQVWSEQVAATAWNLTTDNNRPFELHKPRKLRSYEDNH